MAQEARLEDEKNYRAEQQLAKDRRIREQKAYRDFLFCQMNERKASADHRRWQENLYLEHRMMTTNDHNVAIKKHVGHVDVHEMQKQPKEVNESAQMT